jgi:hypothetical protein
MPIREVISPISRKGSAPGSPETLSPGAKSNSSRRDSVPEGKIRTENEPPAEPKEAE